MTGHDHLEPGATCPTCERRVPYPKRDSSPSSKVKAYRVPADEIDAHEEILEAAARELGYSGKPFHLFWTVTHGLVLALQEARIGRTGDSGTDVQKIA